MICQQSVISRLAGNEFQIYRQLDFFSPLHGGVDAHLPSRGRDPSCESTMQWEENETKRQECSAAVAVQCLAHGASKPFGTAPTLNNCRRRLQQSGEV